MTSTRPQARRAAIHWFRKGLRLNDNPSLLEACQLAEKVYPVFVLDPYFARPDIVGLNRYRFLLETLDSLDADLKNIGSRLYLVKGPPLVRLKELMIEWDIELLTFESDAEPYAKIRDAEMRCIANELKVEVRTHDSHTLHAAEHYEHVCGSKGIDGASQTYQSFCKIFFDHMPSPRKPLDAPTIVGSAPCDDVSHLESQGILYARTPSLNDLGYLDAEAQSMPVIYPGGEQEGLRRLNLMVTQRPDWVNAFEKPLSAPNSLEPSTTVMGPYLKFGCVSPAKMYSELLSCQRSRPNAKYTQPPVSLVGQLLWREFFYLQAYRTPNFDRMVGNPHCRQIPWSSDPLLLAAWSDGRTGYPFIDAIMNQLRTEGWIHHLARHAVACFLTRGDLWQSWEAGAKVFDRYLLDADWAINNANWQWLSCSRFFHMYFRCYSPVAFGKKTDPNGDYIRKYVPALSKMPTKYIYEPWKAPIDVQRASGCIVGEHYPLRIVEHETVSKENMARMQAAYAAHHSKDGAGAGTAGPDAAAEVTASRGDGNNNNNNNNSCNSKKRKEVDDDDYGGRNSNKTKGGAKGKKSSAKSITSFFSKA